MEQYRQTAALRQNLREAETEFITIDDKLADVVNQIDVARERWGSVCATTADAGEVAAAAGSISPSEEYSGGGDATNTIGSMDDRPAPESPTLASELLGAAIRNEHVATRSSSTQDHLD